MNLLGKKGDQFFADGFFGQHLDAVVEAQAALGHRAKQIDAEAGAQGIGKKGAVAQRRAVKPEHSGVCCGHSSDGGLRYAGAGHSFCKKGAGRHIGHNDMVAVHIVHKNLYCTGQQQAETADGITGGNEMASPLVMPLESAQQRAQPLDFRWRHIGEENRIV